MLARAILRFVVVSYIENKLQVNKFNLKCVLQHKNSLCEDIPVYIVNINDYKQI